VAQRPHGRAEIKRTGLGVVVIKLTFFSSQNRTKNSIILLPPPGPFHTMSLVMSDRAKIITKVWIEEGCIVCDACEGECPEVFDVQEETCIIREPATKPEFLRPRSEAILSAVDACPEEIIKYEFVEAGATAAAEPVTTPQKPAKPAPNATAGVSPAPAAQTTETPTPKTLAKPSALKPPAKPAPVAAKDGAPKPEPAEKLAKVPAPPRPKFTRKEPGDLPDPLLQALSNKSALPAERSTNHASANAPEATHTRQTLQAIDIPADAPPDMRAALLAAGGAYIPRKSISDHVRSGATRLLSNLFTRRKVNLALAIGWGSLLFCGASGMAMMHSFMSPKAAKEPKKIWKVGRAEEFASAGSVYEQFKRTPAGEPGFFLVNLAPEQDRLVAIATTCTHLGCIPDWLKGEMKFKCPCHGSGFFVSGINFEGPAPRPLERYRIYRDADGNLVVDMTRVYRQELGEWDNPNSFVSLV
jgi:cytochrome b6-f complex iron-sulfur subunit